jgi:hypothetical protein
VDTVLIQIPMMTTSIAANQAEVAANHSEVLSQLRLLKDLVLGQQAGLNDLKEKMANLSEEVNASEQNSPYTEREELLRHRLIQSRDQLTQSRKDRNLLAQQLRRTRNQFESRQSSQCRVQVKNFTLPPPPNEATFVMSFNSIGADNARRASRMSSGSSTAAGTGGNANESAVEEINDNESKAKEGKKCMVAHIAT